MTNKPILVVDFDGVLHQYISPWQGSSLIRDEEVPGAIEWLRQASEHFKIAIYSARSKDVAGIHAMRAWLIQRIEAADLSWFYEIDWPTAKPAAFLTLDDRAIQFTGQWPNPQELLAFRPWNHQQRQDALKRDATGPTTNGN